MINRWTVTGDCHANFTRFKNYDIDFQKDPNAAVIILGDAGFNFYLDEHDDQLKNSITSRYNFRIYCVRGNHEARPQDVPGMELVYDEDVGGDVYMQPNWPTIRYFKDWGLYYINKFEIAVIGGAYSVDKWYRLDNNLRWFENEMLTDEEMLAATVELTGAEVDMVFTHTCPICWEPRDLFLPFINQKTVDKSMELFLEEIAKCFGWKVWLFGHYHCRRLERPGVEQFYRNSEDLNIIWNRWKEYFDSKKNTLEWYLNRSPMFYADDELLKIREEYWSNIEDD